MGVRPAGGRSWARAGECQCPRSPLGFCAYLLAKWTRRTAVSQAVDAVSLARPAAVSILDVFAGFMGVFGQVPAALRRWYGPVADVSSVHTVRLQLERTRTALTGSDFQGARTAHLRRHTKYGACAFANSISWTLESQGIHTVSFARPAAVSNSDLSGGFMDIFRNLCAAPRRQFGTVAITSRVRKTSFQPGRLQTAPTPSRSQATTPANPLHHPPPRAHPLPNSIPRTLALHGTHPMGLARPANVLVSDLSAVFMGIFRNVHIALRH